MRAAIILKAGRLISEGERFWGACQAAIVDLDRIEHEELPDAVDPSRVHRIPYNPKLWTGSMHETEDAARRAEAEARAWAKAQGLTLHRMPRDRGRAVTGAEADIEANYPGGYRAYLRDERPEGLTPAQEAEAVESGRIAGASGVD